MFSLSLRRSLTGHSRSAAWHCCLRAAGEAGAEAEAATPSPMRLALSVSKSTSKTGSVPAGFNTGTSVAVLDNSCVDPISNATVTMNGVILPTTRQIKITRESSRQGQARASILGSLNGATYSGIGYPVHRFSQTNPGPAGRNLASLLANSLTWSGGAPLANISLNNPKIDARAWPCLTIPS